MVCNRIKLESSEFVKYSSDMILTFINLLDGEKEYILFDDNMSDSGTVEVFNEIFPLSAFGIM